MRRLFDNEAFTLLFIVIIGAVSLFVIGTFMAQMSGCGGQYPQNTDSGTDDMYDKTSEGELCLPDYVLCRNHGECCNHVCVQMNGWWYPRCVPPETLHNQAYPEFGYYENQCQWDACGGPQIMDPEERKR